MADARPASLSCTPSASLAGATILIEEDGRCRCTERAVPFLLSAGLFERDPAAVNAIRPQGALKAKVEDLTRAALSGERPSCVIWRDGEASYLASAGTVTLPAREAVVLDVRPLSPPGWSNDDLAEAFGLTDREADVTRGLLHGDRVATIAARLRLKTTTVRQYLKLIYSKTSTENQAQLVAVLSGGRGKPAAREHTAARQLGTRS